MDYLPKNLKKLGLYQFSKPIDNLPESLTSLTIGHEFNRPIKNLPPLLKRLKIGDSFNQLINYLPRNLHHLSLGDSFDLPLINLPTSLKKLYLGNKFNQLLSFLPLSLTDIRLGLSTNQEICHLPNLKYLRCSGQITFINPFLPSSLNTLILDLDTLPDVYLSPKVELSFTRHRMKLCTKSMHLTGNTLCM